MFESDDWDLDQDFLNDVDDKSTRLLFPIENQEIEPKRRKVEVSSNSIFSSNNDVDLCEKKTAKIVDKTTTKCDEDKVSRKNLILGMFNKNLTDTNVSQDVLSDSKKSCKHNLFKSQSDHIQSCVNNQLPRKNLVLGILKKQDIEDKVKENNMKNSESQKTELNVKNNCHIIVQRQESVLLNGKIKCQTSSKNPQETKCSNNDNPKQSTSENSRKQLLYNIWKQRSIDNAELKSKTSIKGPQVQPNKKMTLVRRFPGPAGLLPDDIDSNVPPISYLNSLEENENTIESNDTDLPEYCSQNTKDLFTEGAWQLMLNDLPDDFLKGYEIATIKQMANANGYNNTKIDFLAGIVERIDHSHDNPPIVLKDFTDSIQGIVHRDIPLKYPGLLEANVVILLHDVGLLKTSGSFVSNKYQILISPSSLLAIYSNKGKIERTHSMESILENGSYGEVEEDDVDHILTEALEEQSSGTCSKFEMEHINSTREATSSTKSTEIFNKICSSSSTNLNETFGDMNQSINFNPIDDFSFLVSPNNITNSQNKKNFCSSVSKNVKHINKENKQQSCKKIRSNKKENVHNDCKQKSENLLQTLKRFSSDTNVKKMFSYNSSISQMNVEHPVSTSACLGDIKSKILNNTSLENMDVEENDVNMSQEETESVVKKLHTLCHDKTESVQFNNKKNNKVSVRSRLLQFKNTDMLTPPQNSESTAPLDSKGDNETLQNKKSPKNPNSSSTILYNAENDSDDEMLSQLDMDTIFSNYNNH